MSNLSAHQCCDNCSHCNHGEEGNDGVGERQFILAVRFEVVFQDLLRNAKEARKLGDVPAANVALQLACNAAINAASLILQPAPTAANPRPDRNNLHESPFEGEEQ